MHIEISKSADWEFKVRVVDAEGETLRTFKYSTIESARRAAEAWRVAFGDCEIKDQTKALTLATKER